MTASDEQCERGNAATSSSNNNNPLGGLGMMPPQMPSLSQTTPLQSSEPSMDRFTILEVVQVLTSFRQNHERMKLLRVSLSVLRFLSILNFVYTILGVTFLMLALCTDWTPEFNEYQRSQFFRIGLTVSVFAPLASFVDMLALRGLRLWRRALLLPWLFLYVFAISLILANSLAGIFHNGFKWTYLVLMVCSFCLYSAWRHVRAQYAEMAKERPTVRTIEELAADIRDTTANGAYRATAGNDLPPKYEDLEQPPVYTEAAGDEGAASASTDAELGAAGNASSSSSSPSRKTRQQELSQ